MMTAPSSSSSSSLLATLLRRTALVGAALGITALSGCYVVPVQQRAPATYEPVAVAPMPANLTFTTRLYPSNDAAKAYGVIVGVVTNDLNGRGTFTTNINGENFTGEATRTTDSSRTGVANGAGNRGSYIRCNYKMNSATVGVGQCQLSNGAQFTMHVGS